MRIVILLVSALSASCTSEAPRQDATTRNAPSSPSQDSLVLRLPDSAEVWYTHVMVDTAASGETCYERGVEIRRRETVTPVPLLYTFGSLEVIDDTTVRADLMRNCARVDTYLINTKTAQPRRLP